MTCEVLISPMRRVFTAKSAAVRNWQALFRLGITHVLSLGARPHGSHYFFLLVDSHIAKITLERDQTHDQKDDEEESVESGGELNVETCQSAVRWLESALEESPITRVLIHCHDGRTMVTAVILMAMMARAQMSAESALVVLRQFHDTACIRKSWLESLHGWAGRELGDDADWFLRLHPKDRRIHRLFGPQHAPQLDFLHRALLPASRTKQNLRNEFGRSRLDFAWVRSLGFLQLCDIIGSGSCVSRSWHDAIHIHYAHILCPRPVKMTSSVRQNMDRCDGAVAWGNLSRDTRAMLCEAGLCPRECCPHSNPFGQHSKLFWSA